MTRGKILHSEIYFRKAFFIDIVGRRDPKLYLELQKTPKSSQSNVEGGGAELEASYFLDCYVTKLSSSEWGGAEPWARGPDSRNQK